MKLYTLKVDNGDNIENIWSGNEMSDAIHYEDIAVKHWGRDAVWICNNMDEIAVGLEFVPKASSAEGKLR